MTVPHGLGLLVAVLALTTACAGGGDDSSATFRPGLHAAPTRAADCNDLPALGSEPGILLGSDWSAEHHEYGDPVVVHACVSTSLRGRVAMVANGSGIRIRPRDVPIDASGSGVIAFQVVVSDDSQGDVRVRQWFGGGGGDLPGPVVAADGDGWHFVPHQG